MTLLQEIQNIVITIDGQCLGIGRWTWSFEFEKRIDFVIPRSAPRSTKRSGNADTNTDSGWSEYDDEEDDCAENIDSSACTPMPNIIQSQSLPLRRIQPARKVKDAAAAKQKAIVQMIPVAQKICKKKYAVHAIPKTKAPARKTKAPARKAKAPARKAKAPAPKTKAPAPKKALPAPKKAPPARKKAPLPPKKASDPQKKAHVKKLGAKRMRWNNLDLLIKVHRDNVCFFYVIGKIYIIARVTSLQ